MASISARKDKSGNVISYQIKVSRGRDILTGKQLTPFTTTYTPAPGWSKKATERELKRIAGEFEAACKRGEVLTKDERKDQKRERDEKKRAAKLREEKELSFNQYMDRYLKQCAANLSAGTVNAYRIALHRASLVFGEYKLKDITPSMLNQFIADLSTNGTNEKDGSRLSFNTVKHNYAALNSLFVSAVDVGLLEISPMNKVRAPRQRKDDKPKERISYDENQLAYILECADKECLKWRSLLYFTAYSGCRIGEVVGLKWEKINYKTGEVEISENAQYTSGVGTYLTTTKTGKARTITLPAVALDVLREWELEQKKILLGQGLSITGFCFTQENGAMMHPQTPERYFQTFGEKYGLPGFHPHALRHTMASISLSNGADLLSVSAKLGHANPGITLNTYSHASQEGQRKASEIFEKAIALKLA